MLAWCWPFLVCLAGLMWWQRGQALAVAGWLPAWLAGLGMALSSLWVVGYSLRLSRPMAGEARLQEA